MATTRTILSQIDLNPLSLDLSQPDKILFTSHSDIYECDYGGDNLTKIHSFPKNTTLYSLLRTENGILTFVHSFDDFYNPDDNNGVWLVSGNQQKKVFPQQKYNSMVYLVTSIMRQGELSIKGVRSSNLFYAIDGSRGNVWWFDLDGNCGVVMGADRKTTPPLFTGSVLPGFSLYPQYTQSGRAPGIVSGFISQGAGRNYMILNNFSNGFSFIVRLTQDGKDIDADIELFNTHSGRFLYSSVIKDEDYMYLAIPFTSVMKPGHQIIRVRILDKVEYTVLSSSEELGIVADMKVLANTLIITTFDMYYHSKIIAFTL